MNIPEHRKMIHGRTYGRTWRPTDYDPIQRWPRARNWIGTLLTLAVFAGLGVLLAWRG